MSRDPADRTFEAQYWRLMLEDLGELSRLIVKTAEELAQGHIGLVELAWSVETDRDREALARTGKAISDTMNRIAELQAPVARMVDLAGGRCEVLAGEVAEEPGEAPE